MKKERKDKIGINIKSITPATTQGITLVKHPFKRVNK